MKKNKLFLTVSLLFYITMVVVNTLSAQGFINSTTQGDVSAIFSTSITPAGYAFIIWPAIYILIIVALIIFFIKSKSDYHSIAIKNSSVLFWLSCIFNIAWTFAFAYKIMWLSVIFIISVFIVLMIILSKSKKENKNIRSIFDIGIGLYAGWLYVASLVNIAAFLVSIKFDYLETHKFIYAIVLVLSIVGAVFLNRTHNNPFFNISIIWAFVAIMVANGFYKECVALFISLALGVIVLSVISILEFRKIKFKI